MHSFVVGMDNFFFFVRSRSRRVRLVAFIKCAASAILLTFSLCSTYSHYISFIVYAKRLTVIVCSDFTFCSFNLPLSKQITSQFIYIYTRCI